VPSWGKWIGNLNNFFENTEQKICPLLTSFIDISEFCSRNISQLAALVNTNTMLPSQSWRGERGIIHPWGGEGYLHPLPCLDPFVTCHRYKHKYSLPA